MRPLLYLLSMVGTLFAAGSHAATITVQTLDETNATLCTLPDAARSVNTGTAQGACPAADAGAANTVVFDPALFATSGTHDLTLSASMFGSYLSGLHFAPRNALTLQGPGVDKLRLLCMGNLSALSVVPATGTPSVTLSGFSIENCSFGGMHVQGVDEMQLSDVAVRGTSGVYAGVYLSARSLDARQLQLTGNTVGNAHQAPLHILANQTVTLDQILIQTNTAPVAGALIEPLAGTRPSAEITRLQVMGNTGNHAVTGGALRAQVTSLALSASVVANNRVSGAAYPTAAVHVAPTSGVKLQNLTVSGNEGPMGAAVTLEGLSPTAIVDVDHVTVVHNVSTAAAGSFGPISAPVGLWLNAAASNSRVRNSIVCGNGSSDLATPSDTVLAYSLTGPWVGAAGVTAPGTYANNCAAADLSSWLGPLGDHGGNTRVHPLLDVPTSPAIDLGEPAYVGAPTDQRGVGFARVADGRTDIGAQEFVRTAIVSVPVNNLWALGLLSALIGGLARRRRFRTA